MTKSSDLAKEYLDDNKHLIDPFTSEEAMYDFFVGMKVLGVSKADARMLKSTILKHASPRTDLVKRSYEKKKKTTPGFTLSRAEYEQGWVARISSKIDSAFLEAFPAELSEDQKANLTDEQFKSAVKKACEKEGIAFQDFDMKYYRGKTVESVVESMHFMSKSNGLNISMNEPWLYSYWDGRPKPQQEKKKKPTS